MGLQERPICFDCRQEVSASDAVFEAPCGHDGCPSAAWHGVCLMRWREQSQDGYRAFMRYIVEHLRGGGYE